MDNEHDNIAAADNPPTQPPKTVERLPWEQAIVPVEPDEAGETEEGEAESQVDGESEAERLDENDETALALSDDEIAAELSDLQAEADEESRELGLPVFDGNEFRQALIASGAEGLELAEEDLPAFHSFFAAQREAGASATEIGQALGWYLRMQDGAGEQRFEADLATRDKMVDELRSKWGGNYQANINELKYLMRSMPDGVGDAIQSARLDDGTLLVNADGFAETFLRLAKSGARAMPNPKERLEEISDTLRENPQKYFREKLDEEAIALRRKSETTPQRGPVAASISRQLAEVSKVLRDDPQRYWRENMGDRAIELRRQLAQVEAANAAKGR